MHEISKFQFVTPTPVELSSFYSLIEEVCNAGVRWVQLRDKSERLHADRKKIAENVKTICKKHDAVFCLKVFLVSDY